MTSSTFTVSDTIGWLEANGSPIRWQTAADRYSPTRRMEHGGGWFFTHHTPANGDAPASSERRLALVGGRNSGTNALKDSADAVYLADDGITVTAMYVIGYRYEADGFTQEYLLLAPVPTEHDADGSRKVRPDGRPVRMDGWYLKPSTCYHLKISQA